MPKQNKKTTYKNNFYLTILDRLKLKTNLEDIKKELFPNDPNSNQKLNYYLRELKKRGLIYNKGYGWWELNKQNKNTTKYDSFLEKDFVRGHAYIWEIKPRKLPENWKKRLELIKKKNINHKLVGAKETTPRIKALGRKVWLCNNHIRIFDTKKQSYYGETAVDSRKNSFLQLFRIIQVLENKLGFSLKPFDWEFKKEHYALIKNDLAIDHNEKGIILRIKDENNEEFLLIDDSLGMGGELENVGKDALKTNIPMRKWWIEHKKTKFQVTPSFIMESINKLTNVQLLEQENKAEYSRDLIEHKNAIKIMSNKTEAMSKTIELLANVVKDLSSEVKKLKKKDI